MDTLNRKSRNLESMGKFAMYYKVKKHYKTEKFLHTINNIVTKAYYRHSMCL